MRTDHDPLLPPGGSQPGRTSRTGWRRRLLRLFVVSVLGATTGLINPSAAGAVTTRLIIGSGKSSCPAGYVCLWTLNDFTGTGYAFYNSESDYSTLPSPFNGIQDYSWSFYSHGNTYDIKFYRHAGQSGEGFVLCRGEAIASLPANSTLPTVSSEPGRGWRDQVSSHKFGAWC